MRRTPFLLLAMLLIGATGRIEAASCVGQARELVVEGLDGAYESGRTEGFGLSIVGTTLWRVSPAGLTGWSISDPAHPALLGFLAIAGRPANRPALIGETLALATESEGIVLVDLHDPSHPAFAGGIRMASICADETGGCARRIGYDAVYRDVTTDGGSLFAVYEGRTEEPAASWWGIQKWSLQDPAGPKLLAESRLPATSSVGGEIGHAGAIAVLGGRVYWPFVAWAGAEDEVGEWKLRILDAGALSPVAGDATLGPGIEQRSGPRTIPGAIVLGSGRLYIGHSGLSSRLYVVDISNPAAPSRCGELPLPGLSGSFARLVGRLFLTHGAAESDHGTLSIVGTGSTCTPASTAEWSSPGVAFSGGLAAAGGSLYATDRDGGILVFDVGATVPQPKGAVAGAGRIVDRVALSAEGTRAWATTRSLAGAPSKELLSLDLSNASHPSVGTPIVAAGPVDCVLAVSGLLLASGEGKVEIRSTANPSSPSLLATLDVPLLDGCPSASGTLLAVPETGGIGVFDLSSPSSPLRLASIDTAARPTDLQLEGTRLTTVLAGRTLAAFDLTTPGSPLALGELPLVGTSGNPISVSGLATRQGFAFALESDGSRLVVADLRTAGSFRQAGLTALDPPGRRLSVDPDAARLGIVHALGLDRYGIATNPGSPTFFERIALPGDPSSAVTAFGRIVASAGGIFVVADLGRCIDPGFTADVLGLSGTFGDVSAGSIVARLWSFGDGELSTSSAPVHTWKSPGEYAVRFDAWGPNGLNRSSASRRLEVGIAPGPSIRIMSPSPGETIDNGSVVTVAIEGFALECDFSRPNESGRGHWILRVDDAEDGADCSLSRTLAKSWAPGARTLVAELVANDGVPLDPPVRSSVGVVFSESQVRWIPTLLVPGQARSAGAAGAFFRSTLWLTNLLGDTLVRLRYVPAEGAGSGGISGSRQIVVPQGGIVSHHDVLTEVFGASSDTFGNLVVDVAEGLPVPVATARTYNDAGTNGTFGQYIPAVPLSLVPSGAVTVEGLAGGTKFRSNVGVVNLSLEKVLHATVELRTAAGQPAGNPLAVEVKPGSVVQLNRIDEQAGTPGLGLFSVSIVGDGPLFAYASKLDNVTSDPIFVPAALSPRSTAWIDGLAVAAGSGGTFFRSNLVLVNRSTLPAELAIHFTPRGDSGVTASKGLSFAPGETKFYSDALFELFGFGNAVGSVQLSSFDSSRPIAAWARTWNDLGERGSFGQFIPAFGYSDLVGARGAVLPGLSDDASFRSNLGLLNTSNARIDVTVTARDRTGNRLGEKVWSLDPGQSRFVFRAIPEISGGASTADGYLFVIPSAPSSVYCWASIVDNVSTDQTFVRPAPMP